MQDINSDLLRLLLMGLDEGHESLGDIMSWLILLNFQFWEVLVC